MCGNARLQSNQVKASFAARRLTDGVKAQTLSRTLHEVLGTRTWNASKNWPLNVTERKADHAVFSVRNVSWKPSQNVSAFSTITSTHRKSENSNYRNKSINHISAQRFHLPHQRWKNGTLSGRTSIRSSEPIRYRQFTALLRLLIWFPESTHSISSFSNRLKFSKILRKFSQVSIWLERLWVIIKVKNKRQRTSSRHPTNTSPSEPNTGAKNEETKLRLQEILHQWLWLFVCSGRKNIRNDLGRVERQDD